MKLKLWTGRVVEVVPVGVKRCKDDRCSGHWTATEHYVCTNCGALFSPVEPDDNLGPDATARAWKRSPPDRKTLEAWKEIATDSLTGVRENDGRIIAAREMLERYTVATR